MDRRCVRARVLRRRCELERAPNDCDHKRRDKGCGNRDKDRRRYSGRWSRSRDLKIFFAAALNTVSSARLIAKASAQCSQARLLLPLAALDRLEKMGFFSPPLLERSEAMRFLARGRRSRSLAHHVRRKIRRKKRGRRCWRRPLLFPSAAGQRPCSRAGALGVSAVNAISYPAVGT